MRCPKCGYISFDQQETCSKCGKGINLDKVGITGTVFDVPAPNFLNMEGDESETDFIEGFDQTFSDNDETEIINDLDMGALGDDSGDIEEEEDFEFDMGGSDLDEMDLNALEDSDETAELELTGFEEEDETLELEEAGGTIGMEDELELDFGEEPEAAADEEMLELQMEDEEPAKPSDEESPEFTIDDDLDFSDLKGPEEEELIFGDDDEETITLDDIDMEAPAAAPQEQVTQPAASSTKEDANLEDLQFEGIKLEDSSLSAPPAEKAKSAPKNVKTGTALDDFEIDLGDLFSEDE